MQGTSTPERSTSERSTSRLRRGAVALTASAALAVGVLAIGSLDLLGTASATQEPGTESDDPPRDRIDGPLDRALDGLVADGTLDREQADAVVDAVRREFGEQVPDRRFDRPRHFGHLRRVAAETAADTIGISVDELKAELGSGSSLAEVAEANGVDRQTLVDALVAAAEAAIGERAPDDADPERIEELKDRLPELVERLVDRSR